MLSERLVPAQVKGGQVLPSFLGTEDLPWVTALLKVAAGCEGSSARELELRLAEPEAPIFKARATAWLIKRFWRASVKSEIEPREARMAAFVAAAERPGRALAMATAAERLGATPAAVEASLFADLPGERIVHPPAQVPDAGELVVRTNLLTARSLLLRAGEVLVHSDGEIAPLVHLAKRKGLLCSFEPPGTLRISGPFALFRRTLLYGRALGDLLPALAAHGRFELKAECTLRGASGQLRLSSESPIFPPGSEAAKPNRGMQKLVAALARLGWEAHPQFAPVRAGETLVFPDWVVRHGDGRCFFVEMLGFWTPEHVQRLLSRPLDQLVLCVDEERRCADGELPSHPRLVCYRRRLDAAALLAAAPPASPVHSR